MSEDLDWRLIDSVLAGEATPAEAARLQAWAESAPERSAFLDALRAQHASGEARVDIEAAWRRVAERTVHRSADRVRADEPARQRPALFSRRDVVRSKPRVVWRIAAAALLVAGSAITWRVMTPDVTDGPIAWRTVTVPNGGRSALELPDGSRVTLNAGSQLRYASGNRPGPRDVYLEGEAVFTVTHDARRPFRVHAGKAIAQDIGTVFAVRAYAELATTTVVVAEGTVSLRAETTRDSVILTAGRQGRVDATGALSTHDADTARFAAWMRGRLVLDNLTLREAAPQLARQFDVEIQFADAMVAERHVTAQFQDAALADVLSAIATALEIDVRRDGRRVMIAQRAARR